MAATVVAGNSRQKVHLEESSADGAQLYALDIEIEESEETEAIVAVHINGPGGIISLVPAALMGLAEYVRAKVAAEAGAQG